MSVRFEKRIDFVGGAAMVAKHLKAAGADVTFSTVLGDDAFKDFVLERPAEGRASNVGPSSMRRGRPRTRTPSLPAATAC